MKSQILRNQTYTRGSINHIINENNRDGTETTKHKNENIDRSRSHLNISHGIEGTGYRTWKKKLEKMKIPFPTQRTGNIGQIMITASPNFFKECGWSIENAKRWESYRDCPKEILSYFSDAIKFCKEYLGEENILSWHLHFDETSPNLHVNYIPIFEGMKRKNVWAKDENGKYLRNDKGEKIRARDENGKVIYDYVKQEHMVNASAFWEQKGGKKSYRNMQNEFYEKVAKKYNLDRGEIGSKARHKNHHEFNVKIEEQAKQIEENNLKLGRQDEFVREYVETRKRIENGKTDPVINAAIEAAQAEEQQKIFKDQTKELLKAIEMLAPDKVKDIKKLANKNLDEKYIEAGEKISGLEIA